MDTNEEILKRATEKARDKCIPVPVYKSAKRYEHTILLLTDLHIPYHDEGALRLALEYGAAKEPDTIIVSELPDFYKISRWNKDPERMDFLDELQMNRQVVRMLSRMFRTQRKIYMVGNHDLRLIAYLRGKAEELSGLPELALKNLLGFTEYGWEYVDNKDRMMHGVPPLKIGHLTFIHGHEVRTGWGAVNLAKIYYERCRTNVIVGHHHRTQEWIIRQITGQHEGAWLVGGLCNLSPEFLTHNDWIHGFALIRFDADGDFKVKNKKIINGKVL